MPILWIIFHYRNQAFIFGDHGVREGALHRSDSSLNLLWRIAALALQRLANFLKDLGRPLGRIERRLLSQSEERIHDRHRRIGAMECTFPDDSSLNLRWRKAPLASQSLANFLKDLGRRCKA